MASHACRLLSLGLLLFAPSDGAPTPPPRRRRSGRGLSLADWDSDGDLDAVVGGFDGRITYYENNGQGLEQLILSDGVEDPFGSSEDYLDYLYFSNASGASENASENASEWAGENGTGARLGKYGVEVGDEGGAEIGEIAGESLSLTRCGRGKINPEVVDWDGDGDLDFLFSIGTCFGMSYFERIGDNVSVSSGYCYNHGHAYQPTSLRGTTGTVEASASACQERCAGVRACAHFSFWTSYWSTNCHLQDSSATLFRQPSASSGPPICPDGSLVENSEVWRGATWSTGGLKAIDFDGDGDLDLFMGSAYGRVKYFENVGGEYGAPPAAGRRTPTFCFSAFHYQGDEVGEFTWLSGPLGCQARCKSVSGCAHFTWLWNGVWKNCRIHGDAATGSYNWYDMAGPPECPVGTLMERTGDANPLGHVRAVGFVSPEIADLDHDGDLDALIGDDYGGVRAYWNSGGLLKANSGGDSLLSTIHMSGPGAVRALDLNRNGMIDILMVGYHASFYRPEGSSELHHWEFNLTHPGGCGLCGGGFSFVSATSRSTAWASWALAGSALLCWAWQP